ncbi:RHS repeat domain-containing protein, partial [Arenimonas oryziterrae]
MRLQKSAVLASVLLCLVSVSSNAVEFKDEYSKQIKSAEQVGALGPDMFGEETNFYTGTTEFRATDVSLPGNYSVPVSVGRRFTMDKMGQPLFNGAFGDWDLDIPHLQGIFAKNVWQSSKYNSPNSRCSVGANNAQPPTVSHQSISWSGTEYWSGNTLYVPGAGSQEMLSANATNNPTGPTDGKTYYWVTNNQWYFSCLSATANGVAGEAFLAVAPDGTTYKFDWVVKRDYAAITKTTQLPELMMAQSSQASVDGPGEIEPNVIANSYILPRQEFWIMPTEITDRHGNTVHYTYDSANPWRLKSIETDWGTHVGDGRKITLTYNAAGKVSTVSDGTRTWTYTYVTGGPMVTLSSVTLPDNSAWQIHLDDLDYAFVTTDPEPFSCENMGALYPSARTGTMTHPSGATGTFYFEAQRHGRSYVTKVCDTYDPAYSNFAVYPKWYDVIALKTKTISGPGMTTAQWAYTYGPANASFADECASGCPTTRTVEVSAPAGEYIRYTFGNKFLVNEGKLLKVERGSGPTGILTTEDTTYLLDPTGQIYPTLIGSSPYFKGDRTSEKLTPTTVRTITQQGATFTWQVPNSCLKGGSAAYCFDVYANPTKITRTSAGLAGGPVSTYTSTDLLTYENSTLKWVLGLSKTVTDAATSKVESEVVYDSTSLLPIEFYTFGVLQQKLTYEFAVADAYGVVKTVKDGLNNTTTVGNWYRGIPRLITYADATTQKATVNAIGRLLTTEDQNTYVTSYSYDALGRMTGITYPTGDTTAWNNTTRSFVPVASTEFGLGAGHWKQVVQTGNGKTTTYYDAQWRPRLILTEDTANAATKSYVVKRYDAAGREVFTSYPQGSLTTVDDTLKGVTTVYDAIGRATQSKQDSELILPGQAVPGQLVATTEYLTGFQIRTTNPRGKQTTTSYRAEDSPSTDAPVTVSLPMGVTTSITRDGFGKPLAVTRSGTYGGNAVTATRSYVYDTGERLCKTVNPESGAALVNYDAAGNIDWSADGTALTSLTCDRNAVVATAKTTRTYNSMNRVTAVTTPGNTANMAMTYKPDGLLATIAAANPSNKTVTTTYGYNKRRLPTDELSDNAGVQHSIFYYYDANAHLSSLKYPNGWEIAYAPDALGRATEVRVPSGQIFANAVTYFPNGAISGFFYGNGVKHTM